MLQDQHGLTITARSKETAADFDRAILGYLKYRADAPRLLARTLAADPELGLAHCLAGYFAGVRQLCCGGAFRMGRAGDRPCRLLGDTRARSRDGDAGPATRRHRSA